MSKLDEKIAKYKESNAKLGLGLDDALIEKATKALGPSIYRADAESVSCSDPSELARVKTNFLKKKLGLTDDGKMDKAIQEVCEAMKASNRKYRALFYALLAKKLGKESVYA